MELTIIEGTVEVLEINDFDVSLTLEEPASATINVVETGSSVIEVMAGLKGDPGDPGGGGGTSDHGALTGLDDDDHLQYHNDARGDARYYTQSAINTALAGKSNTGHLHAIGDVSNLQTTLDGKSATGHGHVIGDVTGLQGALDGKASASHNHDADYAALGHNHSSSDVTDLTETVQDIVGAFIVAGTDITVQYDDVANTFTINSTASGGGGTDAEIVRDTIAGALVAGGGIQITVDDPNDTITIASTAVLPTRSITAGTGLTGGGDLSADRALSVSFGSTAGTVAEGNHTHAASAISSGTIDAARLGSGTADATSVLYGDSTWKVLDKASVGLANVDNTADIDKPISTAVDDALQNKADISHTHSDEITLEEAAPGTMFGIQWNTANSEWRYDGVAITARPTTRGDLVMVAIGGATPPAFGLNGDIHLVESA